MKLKYNFVTNEVADKIVAVAVGDDLEKFNGFIKMDDLGAFMFNLLKDDITKDEMTEKLAKQYPDATSDEISECIDDFIAKLNAEGILE